MIYSPLSPVFGKSIGANHFAAVLRSRKSPAAIEASAIYVALGSVDPAVALGQFGAESTYGRAGYAAVTRNWGNIAMATPGTPRLLRAAKIASHWTRAFGATGYSPGNGYTYAKFKTWRDGARAYAALMRTYRLRGWAGSIERMTRKWLGGIGAGYVANIVRIANQVAGTVDPPVKSPATPPVVTPPPPALPPISVTPDNVGAAQPPSWGFQIHGYAGETISPNGLRGWLARSRTMAGYAAVSAPLPVFVLIHGGPKPLGDLAGMDNLANWLAARGAVAVAIDFPSRAEDGQWTHSLAAIRAAIATVRAKAASWGGDPSRITLVCHSFGGFFGELIAFAGAEVARLVLVATEDRANAEYLASVGNPPDPRSLMASSARKVPTTVITASADLVATVAEAQSLVAALHSSGHPGRWLVIDGATHDSILSDVGAITAVLGG